MKKKAIIILGSSRSHGDTRHLAEAVMERVGAELIDLKQFTINDYDYENHNQEDDFLKVIDKVLQFERIVFASPVYWYSISGVMKSFVDRFSDLLREHKDIGRQFRGKSMYLISSSSDATVYDCFVDSFKLTAAYLGMEFKGNLYGWIEEGQVPAEVVKKVIFFSDNLKS